MRRGWFCVKSRIKLGASLLLALLLLLYPVAALEGVLRALTTWARAYLPAMLPFFLILPPLSSPEAGALYERVFARAMRALFRVPGRAAGAFALSLMAGSPAGAIALGRLAQDGMNRGELSRAALLCTGLSPLFLISAVGGAMLGSPELGQVLALSQLGAVLITGLLFRFCWRDDLAPLFPTAAEPPGGSVSGAALNLLSVACYMALFSCIAALATRLFGEAVRVPLLAVAEAASGAQALADAAMSGPLKLTLIALLCGFSGVSILAQNLSRLRPLGLPARRLVLGKIAQGLTSALLCALQVRLVPLPAAPALAANSYAQRAMVFAALALALFAFAIARAPKTDAQNTQ